MQSNTPDTMHAASAGPAATDSYGTERGPRGLMYQATTLAMGLAFLLFAFGCLVTTHNNLEESGTRVSASTMEQVHIGQTREEWLLATLGEPTSRHCVSEKAAEGDAATGPIVQILRYEHVRREEKGGAVFLLFADHSEEEERTTTFFEVTDGIVTRCWTET